MQKSRKQIIDDYKQGRLTLREMSCLLKIDCREAQDLLLREGIPVSSLTERELDMRLAKKARF
jgi:predicted HTH domain antitoxin